MAKKRPCRICHIWFLPDKHAGDRQHVCSSDACQRERHRRSCAEWHQCEGPAERADRLARRLTPPEPPLAANTMTKHGIPSDRPPTVAGLRLDVLRDAVGWQAGVVIELLAKQLPSLVRDAVHLELTELQSESRKHLAYPPRDAIAATRRPP